MKYISGQDRNQVEFVIQSLDETIGPDNEVRLIDAFVESLPFQELGFKVDYVDNGRPAYHPGDLLKLYIYGYLNIIGIEAFKSYLLAFFAVLGSVLASIALFWRDLKYLLHFSFQKMAFHRMDLMPAFGLQFCNKIE